MEELTKIKELDNDDIKAKQNAKDKEIKPEEKTDIKNDELYNELKSKEKQLFKKNIEEKNYYEYIKNNLNLFNELSYKNEFFSVFDLRIILFFFLFVKIFLL